MREPQDLTKNTWVTSGSASLDGSTNSSAVFRNQLFASIARSGVVRLTLDSSDEGAKRGIIEMLTETFANDANRRSAPNEAKGRARPVDTGNGEIRLHSEASFSPAYPKLLWFYANSVDHDTNAPTTIADGVAIYHSLSRKVQAYFLVNAVTYECVVETGRAIASSDTQSGDETTRRIPYHFNTPGVSQAFYVPRAGEFYFHQERSMCQLTVTGKTAFCGHLFHSPREPQIIAMNIAGHSVEEPPFLDEVLEAFELNTYEHNWTENELLVLDNHRMMHGRRAFPMGTKRDLRVTQSLTVKLD